MFDLERNLTEANFMYDVMRSQKLLDKTFDRLIDKILNEKNIEKFDLKMSHTTKFDFTRHY